MIVSLDELKRVIGIGLEDTSEDDNLTRIIRAKTVWVQGETHRRFDTPTAVSEIHPGTGECELYLAGHVDDAADPPNIVTVSRRTIVERFRGWELLTFGEDWERQGDTLLFLTAWSVWPRTDEFKVEYLDGYVNAPEDIKEVILELAMNQYFGDAATSDGTAGVTGEKLGDFSYTAGASAVGANTLSDNASKTLNRYRRKFV